MVIDRRGLLYDSRFVPGTPHATSTTVVYILLRGVFQICAPEPHTMAGPAALLLDENQYERAPGRTLTFRALGNPYRAIDLRLANADVSHSAFERPTRLLLDDETWAVADRLSRSCDCPLEANLVAASDLLAGLARTGLISREVAHGADSYGDEVPQLWSALASVVANHAGLPTLQEVATGTGASLRTIARQMETFFGTFGLVGRNWRTTTRRWRLKLAVLGLSAADTTVAEVARIVGYGSSEAMRRAFRDAGMPSPSTIRTALLEAETASSVA